MQNTIHKRYMAMALSLLLLLASVIGPFSGTAYAQEILHAKQRFKVYDAVDHSIPAMSHTDEVQIFTSEDFNYVLVGESWVEKGRLVFETGGTVDTKTPYYYGIKVDGYEWEYGGPFLFGGGELQVGLTPTPKAVTEPAPQPVQEEMAPPAPKPVPTTPTPTPTPAPAPAPAPKPTPKPQAVRNAPATVQSQEEIPKTLENLAERPIALQEEPATQNIYTFFIRNTSEYAKGDQIQFRTAQNEPLEIPYTEETKFDFSAYAPGTQIKYRVLRDGYTPFEGDFDVKEGGGNLTITLRIKEPLHIIYSAVNKQIGDANFPITDYITYANDYTGGLTFTLKEGEEVATVNAEGMVTIKEIGTATITIRSEETDLHLPGQTDIQVQVGKKKLGNIQDGMIEWEPVEKTYDGSAREPVVGRIRPDAGILPGDEILIRATAVAARADVGEYASTRITGIQVEGAEKYTYYIEQQTGPAMTIHPRALPVTLSPLTVAYGTPEWENVKAGMKPETKPVGAYVKANTEGFSAELEKEANAIDLAPHVELVLRPENYYVGTYPDALSLHLLDPNAGNFRLEYEGQTEDIHITAPEVSEESITDNLAILTSFSEQFVTRDGVTYVAPGGRLVFGLNDTTLYDTVNIQKTGPVATEEVGDTLRIEKDSPDGDITGTVYLSHSASEETRTNAVPLPLGAYRVDGTHPTITFVDGIGNHSLFEKRTGKVTFEKDDELVAFTRVYGNKGYTLTAEVTDAGAGVADAHYTIIQIRSDQDAANKIQEAIDNPNTPWTPLAQSGQIQVEGTRQGYYMVLVKAADQVGNEAVLTSNGTIIDTTQPTLSIAGIADTIYDEAISYEIIVKDPVTEDVLSGVARVEVDVRDNGQRILGTAPRMNSFTLDAQALYGAGAGPDSFDGLTRMEGEIRIPATIHANSNGLTVTVTAYDHAGNQITEKQMGPIRIDTTQAKVEGVYDRNDPLNQMYFNRNRTLTVTVTERNFEEKDLIVEAEVNGIKKVYTMDQIRDGKSPDIELAKDRMDSEGGKRPDQYTDKRTNRYSLLFGGKDEQVNKRYKIQVYYKNNGREDKKSPIQFAENQKATQTFVIDEIKPVLTVIYTNSKNRSIDPGTNPAHPYYEQEQMTVTVQVEEHNFRKEDVKMHLEQKDGEGKTVSAYNQANLTQVNTRLWNTQDTIHSYTMFPFTRDANYALSLAYTDLAGNKAEVYPAHYFTIDTTPPTGELFVTVDGEKKPYAQAVTEIEQQSGWKRFVFNLFARNTIYLDSNVADTTAGIKRVEYALVKAPINASDQFQASTDFSKLDWKRWSNRVVVDKDTIGLLYLRIEDRAGHVAYIASDGAYIVDTQNPYAPRLEVKGPETEIFGKDIAVEISARDSDNGGVGVYAGMETLRYQVTNRETGQVTQTGEFRHDKARQRTLSGTVFIRENGNNSNNIELKVTATDFAGNQSVAYRTYHLDKTKPVIELRMNRDGVRNGQYYNTARAVDVTFIERNFDPQKASLSLQINGNRHNYTFQDLHAGRGIPQGIELAEVKDSQGGISPHARTDERRIQYRLLLGTGANVDIDYDQIQVGAIDQADNVADNKTLPGFTVDNIAPVIRVNYQDQGDVTHYITTSQDAAYHTNRDIRATVEIEERNFRASDVSPGLTQKNLRGQDVNAYNQIGQIPGGHWVRNGTRNTHQLAPFTNDAIYGLSFSYTDLAGNPAEVYPAHYFVVDKTPPTGQITILTDDGNGTYSQFAETGSFVFSTRASARARQSAQDETSGIQSVSYYFYQPGENARGEFGLLTREQLRTVNWSNWTQDRTLAPNQHGMVYMRLIDKAGNVAYITANGGIILDTQEPSRPDISITTRQSTPDFYAGNVSATINVSDITRGGTYAGLRNVTIEVLSNDRVTQSQTYSVGAKRDRVKSFSHNLVVDAEANNSNYVVIRVSTLDWAGNRSSGEEPLRIDITPPRIEVSYDLNEPTNGRFYNQTRTATVRVYERNFSPDRVNLDIQGGRAQVGSWTVGGQQGSSDNNVNTLLIRFQEDADYSFTLDLTDMAGNRAEYGQVDRFTIDQTKPVITVDFDKAVINGKYINEPRSATITIVEHNFSPDGFEADIKAHFEGRDITPPRVSAWTSAGDTHRAHIAFEEDGDYSFLLRYTDQAGNQSDTYEQEEFTLDATPTEVTFEGVEDKSANRGEIALRVRMEDTNFDFTNAKMILEGYNHEPEAIPLTEDLLERIEGGMLVTLPDFPYEQEADDVYTITVTITDLAGNETEETLTFSVNRFGSNYYFSTDTDIFLEEYYHQEAHTITIHEVNPDTLHKQGVNLTVNGDTRRLGPDELRIEDLSKDGEFKEYRYTMDKSLFEKEGEYEVTVTSEDRAGNMQSNKSKESPAAFAVDKTDPGVVITGIEPGGIYQSGTREITIVVEDNMALDRAELRVDDEVVEVFGPGAMAETSGRLTHTLEEKEQWQSISAKVYDAAGNEAETRTMEVLLSTSTLARFLYGGGLTYSLIGLAAIAGGLLFVLVRRRRESYAA